MTDQRLAAAPTILPTTACYGGNGVGLTSLEAW